MFRVSLSPPKAQDELRKVVPKWCGDYLGDTTYGKEERYVSLEFVESIPRVYLLLRKRCLFQGTTIQRLEETMAGLVVLQDDDELLIE